MFPKAQVESDDVSLMVVWLSTRLPYESEDVEDREIDDDDQPQEINASMDKP